MKFFGREPDQSVPPPSPIFCKIRFIRNVRIGLAGGLFPSGSHPPPHKQNSDSADSHTTEHVANWMQ